MILNDYEQKRLDACDPERYSFLGRVGFDDMNGILWIFKLKIVKNGNILELVDNIKFYPKALNNLEEAKILLQKWEENKNEFSDIVLKSFEDEFSSKIDDTNTPQQIMDIITKILEE